MVKISSESSNVGVSPAPQSNRQTEPPFPVVKPKDPIVRSNNTDFLTPEPRPKEKTLQKRILSKMLDIDIWLHNKTCDADYDQVKIHQVNKNGSFEEKELTKDFIASQKHEIFNGNESIKEQRKRYYQLKSRPRKKRAEYLQGRAEAVARKQGIENYDVTKEAIAPSHSVDETKITGRMPIWMSIMKNIAYGVMTLPFRIKISLQSTQQSKIELPVNEDVLPQNVGKLRSGVLFQFM